MDAVAHASADDPRLAEAQKMRKAQAAALAALEDKKQALLLKRDRLTALEEAACPRERSRPRVVLGLCGSACTHDFGTRLLAHLLRDADVRVVCSETVDSWAPDLRRKLEAIAADHSQGHDGDGRRAFGACVLSKRYDELPCGRLSSSAADTLYAWADLFLLAPLSPDALAEISHGIVSDLLTHLAASWGYRLLQPLGRTGIDRPEIEAQPQSALQPTDRTGIAPPGIEVLWPTDQPGVAAQPEMASLTPEKPGMGSNPHTAAIEAEPEIAAGAKIAAEPADTRIATADARAAGGPRIAAAGPRMARRVLGGSTLLPEHTRIAAPGVGVWPSAARGRGCLDSRAEWSPLKPIVAALAVSDRGWGNPATVVNAEALRRRGFVMCERIRVGNIGGEGRSVTGGEGGGGEGGRGGGGGGASSASPLPAGRADSEVGGSGAGLAQGGTLQPWRPTGSPDETYVTHVTTVTGTTDVTDGTAGEALLCAAENVASVVWEELHKRAEAQ